MNEFLGKLSIFKKYAGLLMIFVIFALLTSAKKNKSGQFVPFDHRNPVLYDNDDHRDVYTDEYLFALASAGSIDLKGIITTYSADRVEYDLFIKGRQEIINMARESGFTNLPDATAGPYVPLQRPATNRIEDTQPLNSDGGRIIVEAALQATKKRPLVIIAGGQLTAIADAYLQNPEIADKIIVSGIFGARDKTYNAGLDSWAWAIVLSKFRCLSISDSGLDTVYNKVFHSERPQTPKLRFSEDLQNGVFPSTEFYQWIVKKHHPRHPASYMEQDGDTPAAIPLMRPDYITKSERWRCKRIDSNGMPELVPDNNGPLYLVIEARSSIATKEFWRAIESRESRKHGFFAK
jgi:hypothetical protein